MPDLHIRGLNKSYGDHRVLTDMTFSVHEGEVYGFVGSNGAGKSTTMRIALGVLAADSGEVLLGDTPLNDDLRRRIGYMPEERGLYNKEPIAGQLIFLGRLHGMTKVAATRSAHDLLEQLGLAERAKDPLNDLSLGNQQRVQLAASLIHDPSVLILDEPFSGLDPVAVSVMSTLLLEKAAAGVPVLFSSHQLDLVQRLCDRVGIIAGGSMRAEGTVAELRQRGPRRYEVHTPARGWCPPEATVIEETSEAIIVELPEAADEQQVLRAALAAGPVYSFTPHVPDLTDLFQEVVQA
ncbi:MULTISPECIES: ATP-binding cassette domain-containing protein [unclassified Corynebacterium]|uniref:ABC transporter ATP-binding protein n=1 Tax=unclassified Corynebacterium TaxID=2624378 RepID=UPI0029CA945F|nr:MULTISPECIES: ATP-binding cassette domain-containing protein [unclassified Corynebacterium]WPF65708.1 ATP-binding cassette domain-containing protein [Corynebacterium sp. 22KM0430]WPF68204.1 ATP-binding cassette domain-containing protein [Corynebacterium sp. 21KM1197]